MENYFKNKKPNNFAPAVEVAACYCTCKDKFLLLKRHPAKPYGETWGVPAGKLDPGETPREAVIREAYEECGIDINTPDLKEMGTLFCRIPGIDFIYHMFHLDFTVEPLILLEQREHTEYLWTTYEDAFSLPLISGGAESLIHFHTLRQKS